MRIGFNPSLNYNRFADVINSVTNYTKNLNAGASFNVSKSKDKKYDVTISNEYNYNRNKNSINFNGGKASNVSFFSTNTFTTEATVYHKKVWSVNSTYNFYYRQKTSAFAEDLNNHLLNAKLQRTFKKNEFTAYLQVRDILNQNIGVERNFNGVTYREERNDRLQRYWLVGFTWDFKNKAPKAKEEPAK